MRFRASLCLLVLLLAAPADALEEDLVGQEKALQDRLVQLRAEIKSVEAELERVQQRIAQAPAGEVLYRFESRGPCLYDPTASAAAGCSLGPSGVYSVLSYDSERNRFTVRDPSGRLAVARIDPVDYSGPGPRVTFVADIDRIRSEERAKQLRTKYGDKPLTEEIVSRKIRIGMTAEMVRDSWGPPRDVNRTILPTVTKEQWQYEASFVYFECRGGACVVTAIQN